MAKTNEDFVGHFVINTRYLYLGRAYNLYVKSESVFFVKSFYRDYDDLDIFCEACYEIVTSDLVETCLMFVNEDDALNALKIID